MLIRQKTNLILKNTVSNMTWKDRIRKEDELIDDILSEEPELTKEMLKSLENALSISRELESRTGDKKILKVFEDIGDIFAKAYPEVNLENYIR